jgi:hypothetical protein
MNDLKNLTIAFSASVSSLFAAIEMRTLITIISAIVLPIVFFAVGKAIDVALQIHLSRRKDEEKEQ